MTLKLTPEDREKFRILSVQLGGDTMARRVAHAVTAQMGITTLGGLVRKYLESPFVFTYEVRDLRGVGAGGQKRIMEHVRRHT